MTSRETFIAYTTLLSIWRFNELQCQHLYHWIRARTFSVVPYYIKSSMYKGQRPLQQCHKSDHYLERRTKTSIERLVLPSTPAVISKIDTAKVSYKSNLDSKATHTEQRLLWQHWANAERKPLSLPATSSDATNRNYADYDAAQLAHWPTVIIMITGSHPLWPHRAWEPITNHIGYKRCRYKIRLLQCY